jgi:hypothetical protein
VNGDVHGGHASCGSVTRASRFLIGLVTCIATHDRISAVARAAWRRQVLGGTPTRSVKRVLKMPSDAPHGRRQSVLVAVRMNGWRAEEGVWRSSYCPAPW